MHDAGKDPHDLEALGVTAVAGRGDLATGSREVADVRVDPALFDYLLALARETRQSPSLSLGVSPRGVAMLLSASKAWAYLSGRDFVTPDDVKSLTKPAWRHRIVVRPEMELEGATADGVIDAIVGRVPVPD
jgi:MoxR-like ATPase